VEKVKSHVVQPSIEACYHCSSLPNAARDLDVNQPKSSTLSTLYHSGHIHSAFVLNKFACSTKAGGIDNLEFGRELSGGGSKKAVLSVERGAGILR